MLPEKLNKKLQDRKTNNAFRQLGNSASMVDFSSNDYLGFAKSEVLFENAHQYLIKHKIIQNGSTGSRLLSGNHNLYNIFEKVLCEFHNSESALVFNSGYDANLGFFSTLPQRGDVILYDELIHASIRDGLKMSDAKSYKFKHNDLADLENLIGKYQRTSEIYVVTESVFSMDGDSPDLIALAKLGKKYYFRLIIDEAHAVGVFGENGVGKVQELHIEDAVFARIITFGKAIGCHGAAILGSQNLKAYLVNFCRSFIYTTALPPHTLVTLNSAYLILPKTEALKVLHENVAFFKSEIVRLGLTSLFIDSDSAIHCCVISGNETVKTIAGQLINKGFDVKPILSPTVPLEKERLRFCLHSYNSHQEISEVLSTLATFVS